MLKGLIKIIHELRHAFLLLIVLAFFVVVGINPISVSQFLGITLGRTVGMSVSVPENPFNKLALQLEEKNKELSRKEADLNSREKDLSGTDIPASSQRNLILFLMGGIIFLFILVSVNFYLDWRRKVNIKSRV